MEQWGRNRRKENDMATAVAPSLTAPPETMADLLKRLGGVPPHRVRLVPAPGTATEKDVLALERRYNRLFELVDGVLVEKAMGYSESLLALWLGSRILEFVNRHHRGLVAGADGMLRLSSRLIRIPDISFVSWNRLPGRKVPKKPIPTLAPDWAIEVMSKTNTAREMARKRREYFRAGVLLIWEIDPENRIVTVYTDPETGRVYDAAKTLNAAPVLPDFKVSLKELFAELDKSGQ
jgi:Uma2 family endonuclease